MKQRGKYLYKTTSTPQTLNDKGKHAPARRYKR